MVGRRGKGRPGLPRPVARALGRDRPASDEESWEAIRDEAITHVEADELAKAEELATTAATTMPLRERARLLGDAAAAILEKGHEPSFLSDAFRAHLELADQRLAKGRTRGAAESFALAIQLAFDRSVHFDSLTSPLARDPRGFVRPLEESSVARALRVARGRGHGPTVGEGGSASSGDPAVGTKVVVATRGNANFLGEILEMLQEDSSIDHMFVDFAGDKNFSRGVRNSALVAEAILGGDSEMASRVEERLRPLLEDADVLFVEWCTALAVLVGLVDPGDTRVVVRLHSYEAFTHWPHLLDFSRIDDMVFVSEHLRHFAVDAIPGLREQNAPRLHVLPLAKDLKAYARPKPEDARFTVGLVGWSSVVKDPAWALDLIMRLRAHDDRYRLLLVGADLDDQVSPAAARYAREMRADLAALESAGGVVRFGQTADVASALTEVGVILSSSVRESFHAGLVEGAASGAVPVVRDWPFFAGRPAGARTLFPGDWVVRSPDEAVARILATTQDEALWRDLGARASAHAVATWDWEVIRPGYQRLFHGA